MSSSSTLFVCSRVAVAFVVVVIICFAQVVNSLLSIYPCYVCRDKALQRKNLISSRAMSQSIIFTFS